MIALNFTIRFECALGNARPSSGFINWSANSCSGKLYQSCSPGCLRSYLDDNFVVAIGAWHICGTCV